MLENQSQPCRENRFKAVIPGRTVRVATASDLESCNAVCRAIHGHDRNGELKDSINQGIAKVVLQGEKITGYTSGLTYFNHSVGFSNDDLKALIASETITTGMIVMEDLVFLFQLEMQSYSDGVLITR